ncbi:MAG: ABC transporter ATP-binding protein [Deltaproteobacteria bacterium]|nr:MAG: ABC transporter ATP-binding protein [Deltaproteobacteria bacterium]TMQ20284.1 MAG: ABC transporter ATP-binding protein [Deltaproteobacteria bacterium]
MTEVVLEASGVGFSYGGLVVIERLDLAVAKGEFVACVGPSGCGKTTLLALLGGHIAPARGTLQRRGRSRTIYQDGGLFPWLTVHDNVACGLPPRLDGGAREHKVAEWLAVTRLTEFADLYPHQLSGGMRQRVELARALAAESDTLLLDEPMGSLDYQTRLRMRRELVATLRERPRTVVFVTHDIEEAVQLGDRVIVLGPRPTSVRRVITLPPGRPRLPTAPGVPDAEQAIMEELGLT